MTAELANTTRYARTWFMIFTLSIILTGTLFAQKLDKIGDWERRLTEILMAQAKMPLLQISARYEDRDFNDGGDEKVRSYAEFDSVIDLGAETLLRYRLKNGGARWEQGVTPFYEQSGELINDGEKWIEFKDKAGPAGNLTTRKEITIRDGLPGAITDSRLETGEAVLLSRMRDAFGGLLRNGLASDGVTTVSFEPHPEEGIFELVLREPCSEDRTTFDSARGFPIARVTKLGLCPNQQKSAKNVYRYSFTEPKELVPGLWVPTKTRCEIQRDGRPYMIKTLEIRSAEFRPDAERQSTFNPEMLPGWTVRDQRFGVQFKVGEDPKAMFDRVQKALPKTTK